MDKFLRTVDKTASQIAQKVGARDAYAAASGRVLDALKPKTTKSRALLVPGYVVQLRHSVTKQSLQIVRRYSDGKMVADTLGGFGQQWFNAHWVVQEASAQGSTRIRLHNSYNFLAMDIAFGASIQHIQPHLAPPKSAEWIIYDCTDDPQYVVLESVKYPMNFLAFDSNGLPILCKDKQSELCKFAVLVQTTANADAFSNQTTSPSTTQQTTMQQF